jgi:RNA polymerase sigma factor FliA
MHRAHARYAAEGDGDAALLQRHAGLVDRLARRLAVRTGGAVTADDLWSAGALGLLEAARRFEPGQGARFETFAEHRVKGAMLDELRRLDHLPRRLRDQADAVAQAGARLEQSLGRAPTTDELCARTGMAAEDLAAVASLTQVHAELPDALEAPLVPTDVQLERGEQARALAQAVAGLPERLQLVLSLHYVEGLTYREIAKVLEVSEPRVCQLHGDAVARLRAALGGGQER